MRTRFLIAFVLLTNQLLAGEVKKTDFSPCDINGDGITDIFYTEIISDAVVNKYKATDLVFHAFVAKIFYGTPQGLSSNAAWSFTSDSIENFNTYTFKYDINNDGIKDLLAIGDVMSPQSKKTHPAIITILNSKDGFTNQLPIIVKEIDMPASWSRSLYFCDCNHDGIADVVVKTSLDITKETSINHKPKVMYGTPNGFSDMQNFTSDDRILRTGYDYDGDKQPDTIEINYGKTETQYSFISSKKKTEEKWISFHDRLFSFGGENLYQIGDINGDGFSDACFLKIEGAHAVKKDHVAPYALTIFPGSSDGLISDTLLYWAFNDLIFPGAGSIGPNSVLISLGDFDGNGSSDIFVAVGEDDFIEDYRDFTSYNFNSPSISYFVCKKMFCIWGGDQPQKDSSQNASFIQLVNNNKLSISTIGDVNGDKKQDILLFNADKQYIIYGNAERNFTPVEWLHN